MRNSDLFRGLDVQNLASENPVSYIDIGTRGGFQDDLAAIAFAVDAIGFEPEQKAFDILDVTGTGPWRSARILPHAIGGVTGHQILSVPTDPVSTTLLTPDPAIGRRFDKSQFFDVQEKIEVETLLLDDALSDLELPSRDFLKIDIEGAELDVLKGSPETVDSLLAVKTEVSFLKHRVNQPLAHDIAAFFHERGFELMDLVDQAHWRREGYVIHPYLSSDNPRYSRGQLVQSDYLFFRSVDRLGDDVPAKIRLALIAMAMGYFDYALTVFESPDVTEHVDESYGVKAIDLVAPASRRYGRKVHRRAIWQQLRGLVPLLRYLKNH